MQYLGIKIDLKRDKRLSELGLSLLTSYYLRGDEFSPQQAFARAAAAFSGGKPDLAQRLYDAASKQWFGFASPILSNAPFPEQSNHYAQPISCFLTYVPDTLDGQKDAARELADLSTVGGGVGQHFHMRGITEKSPGAIPYLKTADSNILYYHQAGTRRGSVAAYLDVDHPDILEFIGVRIPTGGDINRKCLNVNNAVNITDAFLEAVDKDEDWRLRCPHTGDITDTLPAREIWQRILETRFRTGEPYLHFLDESQRRLPEALKSAGLKIHGSNLCSEITLPTNEELTAVCCLSSLNLEYFDEWKGTSLVSDLIEMLDNVLDYFIKNAPPELEKAVRSAKNSRDLGLGYMGFHSYLQRNNIPFESGGFGSATQANYKIAQHIHTKATEATQRLARERGEPDFLKGTGRRNAHLIAIAPTANNALIADCSPSVEPYSFNAYAQRTRVGTHTLYNKYLKAILESRVIDEAEREQVWGRIMDNEGSIQSEEIFTDHEKKVFKTAREIDQHWIITHARTRQPFVCQAQSINLFFKAGADRAYVHSVHQAAFSKSGPGHPLKSLYYLRAKKAKKTESVGKAVVREALSDYASQEIEQEENKCLACEG